MTEKLTLGDLTAASIGQTIRVADGRRGLIASVRHFTVKDGPRTSLIVADPSYKAAHRNDTQWREIGLPSGTSCSIKT